MEISDNCLPIIHKLMQSKDLQEILDVGRQVYSEPLILCDLTHRVLAITSEPEIEHAPWLSINEHGGIPLDKVNESPTLACYRRSAEEGKGQVQEPSRGEPRMLRRALCSGKKIIGYLDSPCYYSDDFSNTDHDIFDLIADLCNLRMEKDGRYFKAPEDMMEFFLTDLMEGRLTSVPLIEERLKYFHWKLKLPLCIITARFNLEESPEPARMMRDVCMRAIAEYPQFTSLVYGDSIKFIVPEGALSSLYGAEEKKLAEFFRSQSLSAGVSRPLEVISGFSDFNKQSEKALELGRLLQPDRCLYFYDNLAIYHTLEYCAKEADLMRMVHSSIYLLSQYDREHDTNLLETLEVYLNCQMNIPKAADQMFVHRNTMSYRVNKIHQLVTLDLENSETVFHLQLSFYILAYYSATVMKDQEEQRKRRPQVRKKEN